MPRSSGFPRGDFDTSFALDPKFMDLGSRLARPLYCEAVGVYWHVVAHSWRTADRATPVFRVLPGSSPEAVTALIAVGLLDEDGSLPASSFDSWIGQALGVRAKDAARKRKSPDSTILPRTPADSGGLQRALVPVVSEGTLTNGGGVGEPLDWLAKRTLRPSAKVESDLMNLVERHGGPAVIAAFVEVEGEFDITPTAQQFVYGASRALDPIRAPKPETREEERARVLAKFRAEDAAKEVH
jgi:hypothetical protein